MRMYRHNAENINILEPQRGLAIGGNMKPENYTVRDEFNSLIQGMMSYVDFSDELMEELNG